MRFNPKFFSFLINFNQLKSTPIKKQCVSNHFKKIYIFVLLPKVKLNFNNLLKCYYILVDKNIKNLY